MKRRHSRAIYVNTSAAEPGDGSHARPFRSMWQAYVVAGMLPVVRIGQPTPKPRRNRHGQFIGRGGTLSETVMPREYWDRIEGVAK